MNERNKRKESESLLATVMFVDISGFTQMSEKLTAEEVTFIMNDCFEMMGSIIEPNDGTIDKFIGDSIMVLFGVPTAIEDPCDKALNAAIEIRNSLIEFNQSRNLKIPLEVHIGINTGKVIAGLIGSAKRKNYTVMGDSVNTAAMFESASIRGQILVGDSTYREASPEFEFKTLQPITAKGKEKPVLVYELLSTKPRVLKPQLDTDRGPNPEIAAREEEFQLKQDQNRPKESERRLVTVMFADISGFAQMSEKLVAEEVTTNMNDCFEMMGSIIEHNGGSIDKFIGDSVMALFGVPTAIENSCNKALNTAIEIRNSLNEFNQSRNLKIQLDVNIGINSGKVIAGLVGTTKRKDYTVMGDTVNTAARMKSVSASGQILVGASTYREASPEFEFKTLQPIRLKGKEKPVPVYELLSTKSRVSKPQLGTDRSIYSEMVGRVEVFNALTSHVHKVINGKGSIVNVIGEPGIGKSRLIVELQKTDEIQEVTFLKGAALSIGKDLSYHPIIEILQKWALIKEEDSAKESLVKLESVIRNVHPEGVEEVLPFVATLMGLKLEGKLAERIKGIESEALEKLIMKNLKDLMTKSMGIRPIIFVVEDVHWADLTSIELLESLFRLADKQPILFINIFRPNYKNSERLLETMKNKYSNNHSEIYLERLEARHVEQLVNNLLKTGTFPEDVKNTISRRAEGNPLFVEEVVNSFIDEGVVRLENGKFQVTEKIHSVVIPASIQDVLMTRLDRLDEENKDLLKKASVIGRYFFRKIIREINDHSEEMNNQLDFLKDVQLIRERIRLKDIEYFFKHVMLQEVTYESILLRLRKELHMEVATAIETVFSHRINEFYGVLSWHYLRGENLEQAEQYLIKAGEEAVRSGASNEVINYYKQALDLYIMKMGHDVDPEKIAALEKGIAIAMYNKGRMTESLVYVNKVLEYRGVRMPKNKIANALLLLGTSFSVLRHLYWQRKRGKMPEQKTVDIFTLMMQKGWALYTIGSPLFFTVCMLMLRLLHKYDITHMPNGLFFYSFASLIPSGTGISFKLGKRMLDYVKLHLTKTDIKAAFGYEFAKSNYRYHVGDWKSQVYEESIVDIGLKIGSIDYTSLYLVSIALSLSELGDYEGVTKCSQRLLEIGEQYENDWAHIRKYTVNTKRLLKYRRLDEVIEEADKGIKYILSAGYPIYELTVLGVKAQALILTNQVETAGNVLQDIEEVVARHGKIRIMELLFNWQLSRFLFDLSRFEQSVEAQDVSMSNKMSRAVQKSGKNALRTAMKYAAGQTEVFRYMGTFHWLRRRRSKALSWWRRSVEAGTRFGARPELARTYLEVGKRLSEKKSKYSYLSDMSPEWYMDKAESLFRDMDLEWDLAQLEKVRIQAL